MRMFYFNGRIPVCCKKSVDAEHLSSKLSASNPTDSSDTFDSLLPSIHIIHRDREVF